MAEKKETKSAETWEEIFFLFLMGLFITGPAILIWQMYKYLRFGSWSALSVIDAIKWCNVQWAASPRDWIGLHQILEWMPLSVLPILLVGLVWMIVYITDRL